MCGAVNFLALNSRLVGEEAHVLDSKSIVNLPVADGRLEIPTFDRPTWKDFIERGQLSGKKWAALTEANGSPHLMLNANRLSRLLLMEFSEKIDPNDCCVEPIITTNSKDTLERILTRAKLAETNSPDKGVILLWADEKRIIAHYDLLKHLFEGVFMLPPGTPQQTS